LATAPAVAIIMMKTTAMNTMMAVFIGDAPGPAAGSRNGIGA
jgi:hypothetical protein